MLAPFLDDRPADAYCFSPAEAMAERADRLRAKRKTKVQPSQKNRRLKKPTRQPGQRYVRTAYGNAIAVACRRAGVKPWAPNRLRHSAATAIRKNYGLEAAQVSLGHSSANVTQTYAQRDAELARRVAAEVG